VGWPIFGTVVAFGGLALTGVPAWRSVLIAMTVGVVLYLVVRSMSVEPPDWPYDVPTEPTRPFIPWEMPGLEGSREKGAAYSRYFRPRIAGLARELLRRRGIEADSDRARTLMGPNNHRLLFGADPLAQPDGVGISRLCEIVARLAVDPTIGTPVPIRNPALSGLAGDPTRSKRRGSVGPSTAPAGGKLPMATPPAKTDRAGRTPRR
jgi:hypothetical protein